MLREVRISMQFITEYIKSIMRVDPSIGNELLRLNMPMVVKELGIKMSQNPKQEGKKENK